MRPASRMRILQLLTRAVAIEMVRRREFQVGLLVLCAFGVGAVMSRLAGIENPATGTFVLNLGLSLAAYAAHVLVLVLASAQMPNEIENRTIHTLLARPLSRTALILGKWVAVSLSGIVFLTIAFGLNWALAPKLEDYSAVLLLETAVLLSLSVALLAILAIALSLLFSRGTALAISAFVYFAGGAAARTLAALTPEGVARDAASWFAGYVPDFSRLDLVTRLTDGIGPLDIAQFCGLVAYAAVLMAVAVMASDALFRRRSL